MQEELLSRTSGSDRVIMAIPKGRLQTETIPILNKINIIPENEFFNPSTRQLVFQTNNPNLSLAIVRSFDVATFVNSGICDLGICGKDVLDEFAYKNLIYVKDLQIGRCRICSATLKSNTRINQNHLITVATKYINITKQHYTKAKNYKNIKYIKLNGAVELAALLNIADIVVDIVSTGNTLLKNGLIEIETIANLSTYLITNSQGMRSKKRELLKTIGQFT